MSPSGRTGMVDWYDPKQLLKTGAQVLISGIFGEHSDRRLVEALVAGTMVVFDYSREPMQVINLEGPEPAATGQPRPHLWLDYVADTGDGWNSTYAIASCVAQDHFLTDANGAEHDLKRGQLLLFGGDEVYPVASADNYQQRLVLPYCAAFDADEPADARFDLPDVYAIPGNHDWYDSLMSFSRLFCARRAFAGCATLQQRSYFALKLPQGWWLLAIDVQLRSEIDVPQIDYFTKVAGQMKDGDRVIVCTPEPQWIYFRYDHQDEPALAKDYLAALEAVMRRPVSVFIAGDIHHYRRHEAIRPVAADTVRPERVQKVTAGGGGAFLHPTHGRDVDTLRGGFVHQKSWPSPRESLWLSLGNLFFLRKGKFTALVGLLYLLLGWLLLPAMLEYKANFAVMYLPASGWAEKLTRPFEYFYRYLTGDPDIGRFRPEDSGTLAIMVLLYFALLFGFRRFTEVRNERFRWVAGFLHATGHFVILYLILWFGMNWFYNYDLIEDSAVPFTEAYYRLSFWYFSLYIFVLGGVLGSTAFGFYLLTALTFTGRHWNEAFSSLQIEDWKHFLRLSIDPSGKLTIYPVGVRRVPKDWQPRTETEGPRWVAHPVGSLQPELIEPPIELEPIYPRAAVAAPPSNP